MPSDGRTARRILATLAAAAAVVTLAACSSSGGNKGGSSSSNTGGGGSGASSAPSAESTAVPAANVISGVKTDSAIAAQLPASVRSAGKLTLGIPQVQGTSGLPHEGLVNGKDVGLDVDLRNAVAKVLGVNWQITQGEFPTIIPGVQNGRYDVGMGNFGVTKARLQVVDFASYITDGQALLAAKRFKQDSVTKLTDVCGDTVGTSSGTTFQTLLQTAAKQCAALGKKPFKVQYFNDTAPIILGLQNGKLDLYFGPTLSLQYDSKHIADTKFLGQVSSTTVAFAVKKGSPLAPALVAAVNELITDGTYAKILDKWGVLAGSGITKSQVNPPATF